MASRPITFLSDYGYADDFAGTCRAVIARIAPDVRVIDITHGLPRHAVRQASVVLANTTPFTPPGVHLAVVDPGVGTDRRPVAVRVEDDNRILVGPDNGLLVPAVERLGGGVEAVDITLSPFRLEPVSATFHGRDLFAPVAAQLAAGASLSEAGDPIEPDYLRKLSLPHPEIGADRIVSHVIFADRYGNLMLDVGHEHLAETSLRLGEPVMVEAGGRRFEATFVRTFADVAPGEAIVYEDSYRALSIAVNRGSATETMRIAADDPVVLLPGG